MAPRNILTVQTIPAYGGKINPAVATLVAGSADNHEFANDGSTYLLALNLNAATRTITAVGVASSRNCNHAIDTVATVAAVVGGVPGVALIGPLPPEAFNQATGEVHIDLSATADVYLLAFKGTTTPAP